MIVSINQPAYLAWPGYFERIARSDMHIILDHVQFEKNSFTNRNKIRTREGWTWLTVPLKTKGRFHDLAINSVETDDLQPWGRKHWNALCTNYAKAPYFAEHRAFFEGVYARPWPRLNDLLRETTSYLLQALGVGTKMVTSTELSVGGVKSELVLNLCRAVGAATYLSGPLGRGYLDEAAFAEAGIAVKYHDYEPPTYTQAFPGFEAGISTVDLLFNQGPASRATMASGTLSESSL
jgi:hypothetical protein